ncbi:MAG: chromosomal replication initiator protein DnaA [Candidatus Thermoplasmatota archaeon]|nr:chromosomal replication initiator protein DnaA [Candidatus Thermoplasmatota archaeon]
MGFLDWFKGGRKNKRSDSQASKGSEKVRTSDDSGSDRYDEVLHDLKRERLLNLEQERKIKEMESRFARMQENFSGMVEKQQMAIERLMSERSSPLEQSLEHPGKADQMKRKAPNVEIVAALSNPILEDKNFDNFVVDEANRFPYLAAEAVATGKGKRYNPLFIYGNVGVGKTHILHAIANKVHEIEPAKTILYSSTEKFTDELLKALERDDLEGFRSRYRNIDVLLVDDIQMLSGKEATQTEFFHMFNQLYNSGKQIVLCSDRPPIDIRELEGRLRSRFEGGLIIDIKVPTFDGRRQVLQNLSANEGYSFTSEVLDYLAFYLDSSVRELEGGFNRVTAYAALMKEPVTVSLVRKVLEGVILKRPPGREMTEDTKEEKTQPTVLYPSKSPYSDRDLELEEETDKLEQELLFELQRNYNGQDRGSES